MANCKQCKYSMRINQVLYGPLAAALASVGDPDLYLCIYNPKETYLLGDVQLELGPCPGFKKREPKEEESPDEGSSIQMNGAIYRDIV